MRGFSTELKVGIFALIVLAILSYMTFKISGREWFRREGQTVYVVFSNISGVEEESRVKVAGVEAGVVDEIKLVGNKARIRLRVYPGVKIYSNATAYIKTSGLIGDKYLYIDPGDELPELKDGDTIRNVREPLDIQDMVYRLANLSANFTKLTEDMREIFGAVETKRALKETVRNLAELTEKLKRVIDANDSRLMETLSGINRLTASVNRLIDENRERIKETVDNVNDLSGSLKAELPATVRDLRDASREMKLLLEENRPRLKSLTEKVDRAMSSVQVVAERIEKGEGTIGKLVADERLYESVNKAASSMERTIGKIERFRTYLTFRGEYLTRQKDFKGYFNVSLKPNPDKYYILGVVGDPAGNEGGDNTSLEFTAQIARRFNNTALRGGLTESTIGAGADQFFLNDKLRLSADIWDFGHNETNAGNPHLKLDLGYHLTRNLFLSTGIDNILNPGTRGIYFGGGITFEDEDFKYIFGTVPNIPR
jgi:phospholipid/cholesterol/gamma-HCH transport system substrate-binding protein